MNYSTSFYLVIFPYSSLLVSCDRHQKSSASRWRLRLAILSMILYIGVSYSRTEFCGVQWWNVGHVGQMSAMLAQLGQGHDLEVNPGSGVTTGQDRCCICVWLLHEDVMNMKMRLITIGCFTNLRSCETRSLTPRHLKRDTFWRSSAL